MASGLIYKATSPSGKIYIGQTVFTLCYRRSQHERAAKARIKGGKFHTAIRKYGNEMVWEVLYENVPQSLLAALETLLIAAYESRTCGYNTTDGGEGCFGFIHTEEAKEIMRALKIGIPLTAEHRKNLSLALMGRTVSEKTRAKKSIAGRGRRHSIEAKEKMSKAKRGKPSGAKGTKRTQESKKKMSESALKKFQNRPDLRENLANLRRITPVSLGTRKKMSEASKHRPPVSKETRKKMSEARKLFWERKKNA